MSTSSDDNVNFTVKRKKPYQRQNLEDGKHSCKYFTEGINTNKG